MFRANHGIALMLGLSSLLTSPASGQIIDTIAGGGPNHLPALESNIAGPTAVIFDSSGNLLIAAREGHLVFRLDASGMLHVIAGIGVPGLGGDNLVATKARLSHPSGLALDGAGNLYIADRNNRRIRRVDAITGVIKTFKIGLKGPAELAIDGAGNLFIADDDRIRRVDTITGVMTTISGTCCRPQRDIALDQAGNLYIADRILQRIMRVDALTGILRSFAGGGDSTEDDVPATEAAIRPTSVALDAAGNIYIGEGARIRRIDALTGLIRTVTTAGSRSGMTIAPNGDLIFPDSFRNEIQRMELATGSKVTIAGNGSVGFSGEGTPAVQASLSWPSATALALDGNLLIADRNNNRIRKLDVTTGLITTIAGNDSGPFPGDGGDARLARLTEPRSVVVDSAGNIIISDSGSNRVRRVDGDTGIITTMAGIGSSGFGGDGGPAVNARIWRPMGLALDAQDNLYIADMLNNRIRRVDALTGVITTVAGTDFGDLGDGGPATEAVIRQPIVLAFDPSQNLYIGSAADRRVRRIDAVTGIITTVAGNGEWPSSGDGGPAVEAALSPGGLVVDANGDLFISDSSSNHIRRVNQSTGIITRFAGLGFGFSGDGGGFRSARLAFPTGLTFNSDQTAMFIADTFNNRIRRISPMPTNRAPLADAGEDRTIECVLQNATLVELDGTGSLDPDGDPLSYTWTGTFGSTSSQDPKTNVLLPLGNHEITLTVQDGFGDEDRDTVLVTVQDKTSPTIGVSLDTSTLWPPNHRMVRINALVTASDSCSQTQISLPLLASSEPEDMPDEGDGNTSPDIEHGTHPLEFSLRAERAGTGDGRSYTVTYSAIDSSGNSATASSIVQVPHDQDGSTDPLQLSVTDEENGTVVRWNQVSNAQAYSVIRGYLSGLSETPSAITLGPVVCIEAGSLNTDTVGNEDPEMPPTGDVFFYLGEYRDTGNSSYGSESLSKPRQPGPGTCK